jgi:hypothetical protein
MNATAHNAKQWIPLWVLSVVAYLLTVSSTATAQVLVAFDWNDATTQGWQSSGTAANVGNKLSVANTRNGSLQIFSPNLSNVNLTGLRTISFDLSINSFSTVASPSELTNSFLFFQSLTNPPGEQIRWNLDLSNLVFGQTRTFTLPIQNAIGTSPLADLHQFSLLFADRNFTSNTSSASLDNFFVTGAVVPEPSSVCTMALGLLLLLGTTVPLWKRKRAL